MKTAFTNCSFRLSGQELLDDLWWLLPQTALHSLYSCALVCQ